MGTETSKINSTSRELLNPSIAIGKRKEESGRLALSLSLQDVFSDFANLKGMQQKTSSLFKSEQEDMVQLQKKESQKPMSRGKSGRKKLRQNSKRSKKLQAHVTQVEYENLGEQFKATGMRYLSDYLWLLILNERTAGSIANKQELIKQLDKIGSQISRIGNNINQVAKYANNQLKSGKID